MKKIFSIILYALVICSFITPSLYASGMEDVHEFDDVLSELNSEDLNAEIKELNRITSEIKNHTVLFSKSDIKVPEFKEIDENVSLSNRINAITNMFRIYEQFGKDVINAKDLNEQNAKILLGYVYELFGHMDKVSSIIKKIVKSSNEDLNIALSEWQKATDNTITLQKQLDINRVMAEKQAEEIAALTKVRNRVRRVSYIELGIGIPTLVLGCLPIWTNDQKNIQNLLLGVGGSLTAAGSVGVIFTIRF